MKRIAILLAFALVTGGCSMFGGGNTCSEAWDAHKSAERVVNQAAELVEEACAIAALPFPEECEDAQEFLVEARAFLLEAELLVSSVCLLAPEDVQDATRADRRESVRNREAR